MKAPVIDVEVEDAQGNPEQVAVIHDDGTIETDEPIVEENIERYLGPNREVPYRYTRTKEVEDEEGPRIEECQTFIEPGEPGYLRTVLRSLRFPYAMQKEEIDWASLSTPNPDVRNENDE